MEISEAYLAWKIVREIARAVKKQNGKVGGTLGVKHYLQLQVLEPLHHDAIHAIQQFGASFSSEDEDRVGSEGIALCTELKKQMSKLVDAPPNGMHCCIKTLGKDGLIATLSRSTPYDRRPNEMGMSNAKPASYSSVWCSLMEQSDGITHWQAMDCFACDDLPAADTKGLFHCERQNWKQWYRSALVFPLRYQSNVHDNEYVVMGFLAFDSPKVGGFRGLPSVFDYTSPDKQADYHDALRMTAPFQLGAIFAHTLSSFLRPYYENQVADESGTE